MWHLNAQESLAHFHMKSRVNIALVEIWPVVYTCLETCRLYNSLVGLNCVIITVHFSDFDCLWIILQSSLTFVLKIFLRMHFHSLSCGVFLRRLQAVGNTYASTRSLEKKFVFLCVLQITNTKNVGINLYLVSKIEYVLNWGLRFKT